MKAFTDTLAIYK